MIAITSRKLCRRPFLEQLRAVAEAGPEMIILREKDLPHGEFVALARDCIAICEATGTEISINSDVGAARELGIRSVHLPMDVLRSTDVSGFGLVGASVHSAAEAEEAESLGADYLIAGHVFPTACKRGEPRGPGFLSDVCSAVGIPVYGVGGITPENYGRVISSGAVGAAAMSSVMTSDDPGTIVRGMAPPGGRSPLLRRRHGYLSARDAGCMDEGTFERASAYIRGLFEGDSSGHDFYHSMRVHDLALSICRQEGGDESIVRLAALLHDADDRKMFSTENHANARRFMDSESVPADVQDRICSVISQISFKGKDSVVPDTLEGRIVQDADRMDAIGAIGIARAFAYGGSKGRAMHIPGESYKEDMSEAEYYANRGTSVNHFHEKLLKLKDMMNTDTARGMAEARHDYMVGFLDEFMAEWEGRRRR